MKSRFFGIVTAVLMLGTLWMLAPMPAAAQMMNTWSNPFTGNNFNNPMSSTLDTMILHSMQRRLTERQVLGTLPSQQGYRPPQQTYMPPQQPSMPPQQATAPIPPAMKPRYPIATTDFVSGPRSLPAVYAAKGPQENVSQLLQTFNQMLDNFEKEGRKNNNAYAVAFLLGVSAQIDTGREIPDPVVDQLILDFNDILAASPNYMALPNQKKQELYESSVLVGGMIGLLATNNETKQQAKDLARQVLASLNL